MCDKYFEEKLTLESKVRYLEEAQRILKEKLRSNERSPPGDQAGSRSRSVREGGDNPCNVDAGTSRKRPAASQEILEDRLGDMSRIDDDICLILNARGKRYLSLVLLLVLIHNSSAYHSSKDATRERYPGVKHTGSDQRIG